jgi:heat shock protein HtpX
VYEQIARNKRQTVIYIGAFIVVWLGLGLLVGWLAEPADPKRYAQLYDLVQALALGDGLPMPAVYVVTDSSPNAFATGISPARASITVTSSLLAIMDREELEGVLGHELSHTKNYDTRLLLIVTTLLGMAALLASVVWRGAFFVRGRGRNSGQLTVG